MSAAAKPKTARSTRSAKPKSPAAKSARGKTPAAPRPRWLKVCMWCGGAALVLLILFLALALMVFSPYRRFGIPELEDRHYQVLNRLSAHASRHLFRRDPPAEVKLRLSVDEVNALLEFARNAARFHRDRNMPPPESFDIVYREGGSFRFAAPIDAAPKWLFGGKIYAEGVFYLEKLPDKLIFDLPELRLGRVGASFPGSGMAAKKIGAEALERAMTPEFKAAVKEFYPDPKRGGSLVLVYRPRALLPLLMNAAR